MSHFPPSMSHLLPSMSHLLQECARIPAGSETWRTHAWPPDAASTSAGARRLGTMRLATWNVNSIRARLPRILDFAVREPIDVLAMQEIKCKTEQFPTEAFEEAGYHVPAHGLNQWNGIPIASRQPPDHAENGFPGTPH